MKKENLKTAARLHRLSNSSRSRITGRIHLKTVIFGLLPSLDGVSEDRLRHTRSKGSKVKYKRPSALHSHAVVTCSPADPLNRFILTVETVLTCWAPSVIRILQVYFALKSEIYVPSSLPSEDEYSPTSSSSAAASSSQSADDEDHRECYRCLSVWLLWENVLFHLY